MNRSNPFSDRILTQAFTPEFMQEIAGVEDEDEILELLETAAKLFERSYNAVAGVSERPTAYQGWGVYIIPAKDADEDSIRYGMQSMHFWIENWGDKEL